MEDKVIYRVQLENNKTREVAIREESDGLKISLNGFRSRIDLAVNGGGVSACRTIIEHVSDKAKITLSLPIPDPRARCRMLPGYVSIKSRSYEISVDKVTVNRIDGKDSQLRRIVHKILGEIEER